MGRKLTSWLAIMALAVGMALTPAGAGAQEIPRPDLPPPGQAMPEPTDTEALEPDFAEPVPATSPGASHLEPLPEEGAGPLIVPLNQARMVQLPADVADIIVVNEGIADVRFDPQQPRTVFIVARAMGSTNIVFQDADGNIIRQVEVRVDADMGVLTTALSELLPNEDIRPSVYQGTVFLKGNVRSPGAAATAVAVANRFVPEGAAVVNMLKVQGSQQVILRVQVAEVARTVTKNISVDVEFNRTLGKLGREGVNFMTASPPWQTGAAFTGGTAALGLHGLGLTRTWFAALEREGLIKTLAEPTLVAVSGETARMLSGGQYPYPAAMDEFGNITYEWAEYGVGLRFTPIVQDDGNINLQIHTSVTELGTNIAIGAFQVPQLLTKRTETIVDLPSGGALMISGLLQDNINETINGFPYLKDIPILGALFRSNEFQRNETELVVLVTAYLAKPTDGQGGLAKPVDRFQPPSDTDFFLLGRLYGEHTKTGDATAWRKPFDIEGPFGYIMGDLP